MELEELIEHIERWNRDHIDRLLKTLERYAENDESLEGGPEQIIKSIRKAIEANKKDGKDMSGKEKRLAELEEELKKPVEEEE